MFWPVAQTLFIVPAKFVENKSAMMCCLILDSMVNLAFIAENCIDENTDLFGHTESLKFLVS